MPIPRPVEIFVISSAAPAAVETLSEALVDLSAAPAARPYVSLDDDDNSVAVNLIEAALLPTVSKQSRFRLGTIVWRDPLLLDDFPARPPRRFFALPFVAQ